MLRTAQDVLRITTADLGNGLFVASMSGELDVARRDELERSLTAVLEHGGPRLIVDLSGVTLLDSAALGVLSSSAKRIRAAGGTFALVTDDPRVLRTLEITGLHRFFEVERSLTEAVAAIGALPPEAAA